MTSNETIWKIQREFMELAKSIEAQHGFALLSVRYNRDDEGCAQSVCLSYEDRTEAKQPSTTSSRTHTSDKQNDTERPDNKSRNDR